MLAFMTLQNLLLMEVSGTVLSKNNSNNPCILPDTFIIHYCNFLTLPYIDMIQYVTVYQGKRKTGYTYCPFFSWGRTVRPKPMSHHSGKAAALPLLILLGMPLAEKAQSAFSLTQLFTKY